MPRLAGVLETALYVDDIPRAQHFYETILGLEPMFSDERMVAYGVGREAFLLFERGSTIKPVIVQGGTIPPHDGSGPLHMAFAIAADQLVEWEAQLAEHGIEIEGRVKWPRGGESIYFRDPDKNLIELATPGLWKNY
jgi:catechol 2,3-dioxygenase-like lactoylglutathione lyase family enzyme